MVRIPCGRRGFGLASTAVPAVALPSPRVVELSDLRVAGGLMLGAGLARPLVPGHPGFPCPLRTLTGIPCPLCGMTTSVTATVHLQVGKAVSANPAGIAAVGVAVSLLLAWRARRVVVPGWLVPLGLGLMWLFELHRFRIL